ncbi:MAG: ABC transporter permease [Deltaproteobacteria bacterium]|nr:ABC transporter permease [Deltaproteobacteria bacterium]
MGYPGFIGSRYLRSRKKSSISAITIIAIIGVALGVAALSVVIAISSGFEEEFTAKVLGVNAHVLVMKYGVDFTEYRQVMKTAKEVRGVKGVAPFIIQEMMLSKGDRTAGVLLKGVDPELLGEVLDLPRHIVKGGLAGLRVPGSGPPRPGAPAASEKGPMPGIILGQTLAENLNAKVGDTVQVTTPLIGLDVIGWSPSDDTPRSLSFKVVGIFYAGFLEYDTKLVYVDLYQAQRFFDHGDSVIGVEITLHDINQAKDVSARLRGLLGGGPYHTVDWQLLNEPLFTALKMQKVVLTIVLAVIIGVAAFNIIATLVMMVFDKRREIAILKSMGASHRGILSIFMYVGTVVGLAGITIGLALGFGVCLLLSEVGWPLDPKVYLIDHLPVRLAALDFVACAGVAFLICLLATIWPSMSASRLKPVDGLRQD